MKHNAWTESPPQLRRNADRREVFRLNRLITVPKELERLKKLKVLHLQKNLLAKFPDFILSLDQLKELNLADNQIVTFPQELLDLEQLSFFAVNGNPYENGSRERDILLQVLEKLQKRGVQIKFDIGDSNF